MLAQKSSEIEPSVAPQNQQLKYLYSSQETDLGHLLLVEERLKKDPRVVSLYLTLVRLPH
jgi:hypothetical protein